MTREEEIKEKAERFADVLSDGLYFKSSQRHKCREHGFIQGAKWADQYPRKGLWDSEKVCKFINENVREYHKSGVFHIGDFIKDLRKAMEES